MVIMRYVELVRKAKGNTEAIIKLPPLQNSIVVLGWTAVFVNLIFIIAAVGLVMKKRIFILPPWLVIFNVVIFIWQIAYHFNLY